MRPTTTVRTLLCNMDVIWRHCLRAFTDDDKIVIKFLRQNKRYGAKRFISEFPEKRCSLTSLKWLIRKIDATGTTERTKGSDRPRTARKVHNIDSVDKLALSQSVRKTSLALIQHREKLRVNWALRSRQLIALCDTIFVWSASKSTERQSWRRRTNKHVWSVPVRCVATQQISSTL